MTPILEIRNLKKNYGKVKAVAGVNLKIKSGTCFGLLGPNGAGKTTTIEIIEGILKPDSGEILFKGKEPGQEFREKTGIQFQNTELPQFLTVLETVKTFRNMYNRQADLNWLIEICQLEEICNRDNKNISGGQKQRLLLAMALINDPELIIMDEPTTGLDPKSRRHLWEIVNKIKDMGKTIILTTHYMEEAEVLCDEIAIMGKGKIMDVDNTDRLIKKYGNIARIRLPRTFPEKLLEEIDCQWIVMEEEIEIETSDLNSCLKAIALSKEDISGMSITSPNLEDVFLHLSDSRERNEGM